LFDPIQARFPCARHTLNIRLEAVLPYCLPDCRESENKEDVRLGEFDLSSITVGANTKDDARSVKARTSEANDCSQNANLHRLLMGMGILEKS
jgi:hypothetical protein